MTARPARRMEGIEKTLIRRIFDAAPKDAINLGLGQPDLPTPPRIALEGVGAIVTGKTSYTSTAGDPRLRAAVAARYPSVASGDESVVITIGSQEAMFASLLALVDPGDEVLVPDPGYPAYPTMVRLVGGTAVPYPLRAERGFRVEPQDVGERITDRTRALVLCNPSNPTGAVERAEDLAALARVLADSGVAWISDEIYSAFVYEGRYVSLADHAARGSGLVVSSLSKDLSMTGWRVGWVVGPPEVIASVTAAHQHLVTCAPSISQAAALAALLPAGDEERARHLEIFRGRRSLMADELGRIPGIRFQVPDGAFYFFVDVRAHGPSLALSRRILERRNVITIPGIAFGAGGEGFIRLSYAADRDSIVSGVRKIGAELGRE